MEGNVFVNNFISIGMQDFFLKGGISSFEAHIIECLTDIYGLDEIKRVYSEKDEAGFNKLLFQYGLSHTVYDNFLRDTVKFEDFKEENKKEPSIKSNIGSKVESSIITMFLYKCLILEPTLEEISHFENNLLNNFMTIKWHFNMSLNPHRTREIWEKKKRMLTDSVELIEIKPEYLDNSTYVKFGTSLGEVKKMDYRMVGELNNYIKSKLAVEVDTKTKKATGKMSILNTVLTSGNGYVDALLIVSIIVTEISIAFIYVCLNI